VPTEIQMVFPQLNLVLFNGMTLGHLLTFYQNKHRESHYLIVETTIESTVRTLLPFAITPFNMAFNTRSALIGMANLLAIFVVVGVVSQAVYGTKSAAASAPVASAPVLSDPLLATQSLPITGVVGRAPRRLKKGDDGMMGDGMMGGMMMMDATPAPTLTPSAGPSANPSVSQNPSSFPSVSC
jgi:hypothetical protein